MMCEF